MRRLLNAVEFDAQTEVSELMDTIARIVQQCPAERNNAVLRDLYRILEEIDINW